MLSLGWYHTAVEEGVRSMVYQWTVCTMIVEFM